MQCGIPAKLNFVSLKTSFPSLTSAAFGGGALGSGAGVEASFVEAGVPDAVLAFLLALGAGVAAAGASGTTANGEDPVKVTDPRKA